MTTRCPRPWARNCAIAASTCDSAATKFVIAMARFVAWSPVPTGRPEPTPALTITRSNGACSANTRDTASSSVTSSAATSIVRDGCLARISSRSCSRRSTRRAVSTRSCPRSANCRAISAPRPALAPVMRIRIG
jgi:hypothetical protein